MKNATIILAPEVDGAILRLIDHVDPSEIPDVLNFLEGIHQRMARTLSDFPEAGALFQGRVRFLTLEGYTYLYEYHEDTNEVHVLDLMMPGQNWR
ncbi:hypothetical protein N5A93_06405 [Roseovarius sp. EGI FJ00037]|uniref:hypothetical protein n=1 Tax=Roseovarius salincola TaxID=2978479 RepID=UPI0022A8BC8F|nr:hypothetical protein [Roseovarius sp. EGI FJ00037]MCZ0811857.1 hypothetical protein [Roseovarius sp. EGI FJ00037]